MRILSLVTDGFGAAGGIARYNRELMTALAARDDVSAVRLLPRNGDAAELARSGAPARLTQDPPAAGRVTYSVRAAGAVLRWRPDLIFCGHLHMAPLARVLARAARIPWWLQLHGIEAWPAPSELLRSAAESADLVTAVSRHTRRRFLSWANVEPHRVRVLPNTLEPRFSPGTRRADLVERFKLQGKRVLLTVGRMAAAERYKGHEGVIRALPRLGLDVCYLVVGDGDDRARLEALAQEQGVAARVVFAGQVAHEELPDVYRLADAFVMPSSGEGFGIVYLEAAACGVPVLGSAEAGAIDALADGAIGSFAPATAPGLADAIRATLDRGPADPLRVERFAPQRFAAHIGRLLGNGLTHGDPVR